MFVVGSFADFTDKVIIAAPTVQTTLPRPTNFQVAVSPGRAICSWVLPLPGSTNAGSITNYAVWATPGGGRLNGQTDIGGGAYSIDASGNRFYSNQTTSFTLYLAGGVYGFTLKSIQFSPIPVTDDGVFINQSEDFFIASITIPHLNPPISLITNIVTDAHSKYNLASVSWTVPTNRENITNYVVWATPTGSTFPSANDKGGVVITGDTGAAGQLANSISIIVTKNISYKFRIASINLSGYTYTGGKTIHTLTSADITNNIISDYLILLYPTVPTNGNVTLPINLNIPVRSATSGYGFATVSWTPPSDNQYFNDVEKYTIFCIKKPLFNAFEYAYGYQITEDASGNTASSITIKLKPGLYKFAILVIMKINSENAWNKEGGSFGVISACVLPAPGETQQTLGYYSSAIYAPIFDASLNNIRLSEVYNSFLYSGQSKYYTNNTNIPLVNSSAAPGASIGNIAVEGDANNSLIKSFNYPGGTILHDINMNVTNIPTTPAAPISILSRINKKMFAGMVYKSMISFVEVSSNSVTLYWKGSFNLRTYDAFICDSSGASPSWDAAGTSPGYAVTYGGTEYKLTPSGTPATVTVGNYTSRKYDDRNGVSTDNSGAETIYPSAHLRENPTPYKIKFNNLLIGKLYYACVANDNGYSLYGAVSQKVISDFVAFTPAGTPFPCQFPNTPVILDASYGDGYINLIWNAPSNNGQAVDGYKIYYKEYSTRWNFNNNVGALSQSSGSNNENTDWTYKIYLPGNSWRSYRIPGLTNGKTYVISLRAHNNIGWSCYADYVYMTPGTKIPYVGTPATPTLKDGINYYPRPLPFAWFLGSKTVSLYWLDIPDNGNTLLGYNIDITTISYEVFIDDANRSRQRSFAGNGYTPAYHTFISVAELRNKTAPYSFTVIPSSTGIDQPGGYTGGWDISGVNNIIYPLDDWNRIFLNVYGVYAPVNSIKCYSKILPLTLVYPGTIPGGGVQETGATYTRRINNADGIRSSYDYEYSATKPPIQNFFIQNSVNSALCALTCGYTGMILRCFDSVTDTFYYMFSTYQCNPGYSIQLYFKTKGTYSVDAAFVNEFGCGPFTTNGPITSTGPKFGDLDPAYGLTAPILISATFMDNRIYILWNPPKGIPSTTSIQSYTIYIGDFTDRPCGYLYGIDASGGNYYVLEKMYPNNGKSISVNTGGVTPANGAGMSDTDQRIYGFITNISPSLSSLYRDISGTITISGKTITIQNGRTYGIAIQAVDVSGNGSPLSEMMFGTPSATPLWYTPSLLLGTPTLTGLSDVAIPEKGNWSSGNPKIVYPTVLQYKWFWSWSGTSGANLTFQWLDIKKNGHDLRCYRINIVNDGATVVTIFNCDVAPQTSGIYSFSVNNSTNGWSNTTRFNSNYTYSGYIVAIYDEPKDRTTGAEKDYPYSDGGTLSFGLPLISGVVAPGTFTVSAARNSNGNGTVLLTWSNPTSGLPSGASLTGSQFRVRGGESTSIATTTLNGSIWTSVVSVLTPGSSYSFTVTADNGYFSYVASPTTSITVYATPGTFTVDTPVLDQNAETITLTWSTPEPTGGGTLSYRIRVVYPSGGSKDISGVTVTSPYTISNTSTTTYLNFGGSHSFSVYASNGGFSRQVDASGVVIFYSLVRELSYEFFGLSTFRWTKPSNTTGLSIMYNFSLYIRSDAGNYVNTGITDMSREFTSLSIYDLVIGRSYLFSVRCRLSTENTYSNYNHIIITR